MELRVEFSEREGGRRIWEGWELGLVLKRSLSVGDRSEVLVKVIRVGDEEVSRMVGVRG